MARGGSTFHGVLEITEALRKIPDPKPSPMDSVTRRMIVTALHAAVKLSPLSQNEIARRVYTTPTHLSQCLTMKKGMSFEMMDRIMAVLGLEFVVTVRPRTFYG